jgi:EmrB/QacA subfamily drug resistance transporter
MDAQASGTRPLTHREMRLIVFGVLLPVFMGSLDQTILAGALPTIGREFGDVHALPWLITAYLIASTAVTPLYGKISDIHGRRFTLRIAILTYMAGSLVCALAPNMFVLILGRTLHGLGGGGLTSVGMIVLGDIAAPKDRGKYYAYFSLTYTTAGACGPALGGFFAEHLHWSAIFWMNIPMGAIAFASKSILLRRLPRHERPHRLDVLGALLMVTAGVSFMLALNVVGVRFQWTSLPILALSAFALVMSLGFVLRLMTAPEPLIPIAILASPIARCAIAANSFGWGSIVGLNIFLPMFLQTVLGMSATHAGLSLMVLMVTLNLSAGIAGHILGRVKHYKTVPILGLVLAIGSVATLAWQAGNLSPLSFELLLAMIGIGFGPLPPLMAVVLQNCVAPHQLGTAVGTMNFSRNLFSTFLVAVFGAIVLGGAPAIELGSGLPPMAGDPAGGFSRVFFVAATSLSVAFLSLLLLEERPLKTNVAPD